jgi:hypothetical protein
VTRFISPTFTWYEIHRVADQRIYDYFKFDNCLVLYRTHGFMFCALQRVFYFFVDYLTRASVTEVLPYTSLASACD